MCLITNPIWVVKTRLQLQQRRRLAALQAAPGPSAAAAATPYRSFVHAVGQIAKHEGWQGFYRGLGPSLIMVRAEPAAPTPQPCTRNCCAQHQSSQGTGASIRPGPGRRLQGCMPRVARLSAALESTPRHCQPAHHVQDGICIMLSTLHRHGRITPPAGSSIVLPGVTRRHPVHGV